MWQNTHSQKDFKVSLEAKTGTADLYVRTFYESQNLVDELPKSKRNALWVLENVDPRSSLEEKELLVVNQERAYCDDGCYYLIGVVTHEMRTEYSIRVEVLDADFENS